MFVFIRLKISINIISKNDSWSDTFHETGLVWPVPGNTYSPHVRPLEYLFQDVNNACTKANFCCLTKILVKFCPRWLFPTFSQLINNICFEKKSDFIHYIVYNGESLLTSLFQFLLISIRIKPWKASPYARIKFNLSSLCSFQLFNRHNKGSSSHRKLRNCLVAKTLMILASESLKPNLEKT